MCTLKHPEGSHVVTAAAVTVRAVEQLCVLFYIQSVVQPRSFHVRPACPPPPGADSTCEPDAVNTMKDSRCRCIV